MADKNKFPPGTLVKVIKGAFADRLGVVLDPANAIDGRGAPLPATRQRAAYLDRACGGDAELRARVEALLRVNDAAPLPPHGAATVDSAAGQPGIEEYGDPTARVGAILAGKYKLVEEIGEGGMGSVFMAQQTEPSQFRG